MKFTGTVNKGKLTLHDKEGFKRHISKVDGDVWLDVKTAPKQRSPQQNAYYRVIVKDVAKQLGYTEDELHDVIKRKFKITSTKDLSKEEFSELLDLTIFWFAQLGFPVDDPR